MDGDEWMDMRAISGGLMQEILIPCDVSSNCHLTSPVV